MINLPQITDMDVSGKKVLVRADLDVGAEGFENDLRIQSLLPTLDFLKERSAQIIVLGHKGRPNGVYDESLSLRFLQPFFDKWGARVEENLRFDPGEEKNDPEFVNKLASLGDIYINEAFAASHREHASIVALPQQFKLARQSLGDGGLKSKNSVAAGFRFFEEVENLSKVFENPNKPLVVVIGGAKEDKLAYLELLAKFSDYVLVGGTLPNFISEDSTYRIDTRFLIAKLIPDKEDMTVRSIEDFEKEISTAGTVVLAGPMGKYEEEGHRMGTKRIFDAVANSGGFKIAGGGDTISAISMLELGDRFSWISLGGGAMLEFLARRTLPGIEALQL